MPTRDRARAGTRNTCCVSARIRPDLDTIPRYVPGKSYPGAIKLASNETTLGPLPSVAKAVAEAVELSNRYPDNRSTELIAALAARHGVNAANVTVGCGSVALCQELAQITCFEPTDEVLYAWRAFEMYPIVAQVAGATSVRVPLDTAETHDLAAMAHAVTDRTRLIYVCNPNNPTGTAVDGAELNRFVEQVPDDVLVVLDEAYFEYNRTGVDGIEIAKQHSNVLVLRTFSKAYGLAGLRVGYAVGAPHVIEALAKVHVPFSVSRVAQAAALASIEAQHELLERTDKIVAERARVRTALLDAGYRVPTTEANFVWLPLGSESARFGDNSAEAGVIVRPYGNDGVRVTIGDPHENDAFLAFALAPDTVAQFAV